MRNADDDRFRARMKRERDAVVQDLRRQALIKVGHEIEYRQRTEFLTRNRYHLTKREFIAGMAAASVCGQAAADTPFSTFSYTVGSETTGLTTATRFAYVVNVKGCGAVGDGSTDDTAAVQKAFNIACGNGVLGSGYVPNGQSAANLNVGIYFPPGKYAITSPIYMKNTLGVIVFGAGQNVTLILWKPTNGATIPGGGTYSGSGNSFSSDGITPCFMTDGVEAIIFRDMGLLGPSFTATNDITGYYFWQNVSGTNGQSTNIIFMNMGFDALGQGIQGGASASNGCDSGLLIRVNVQSCSLAGVRIASANAIDWSVFGGLSGNNSANSTLAPGGIGSGNGGAAYSVVSGSISIYNNSCTSNTFDFYNGYTGGAMNIIGGSSESSVSAVSASAAMVFTGFAWRMANTSTCLPIDCRITGFITVNGCWMDCNTNGGAGNIAQLGNNGLLIHEGGGVGPTAAANLGYTGSGSSRLYTRGITFGASNASRFTNFTGNLFNTDAGVSCSGTPTSSFASVNGIVTHC